MSDNVVIAGFALSRFLALLTKIKENSVLLGLASLSWLIFRSGTKPSRIAYPCQRAAAVNTWVMLSSLFLPFLATAQKRTGRLLYSKTMWAAVATVLIVGSGIAYWWEGQPEMPQKETQSLGLTLESKSAIAWPASDIFVVNGTTGQDNGVNELIRLMGINGLRFYQTQEDGITYGPEGLIARDDVVLIKVNCQWDERGGTNTDLLKALIQAIVNHPEGFAGEIIVADNGQGRGSLDWSDNNAEDESLSAQDVVDAFSDSFSVSTFLWDTIRQNQVDEYYSGDLEDGYVVSETADPETGIRTSYPKFQTVYGTYVSFMMGVWNPSTDSYQQERLKVINVPVLKTHSTYGVTASVKHYMGVVSQPLTDAHSTVGRGGMGTEMVETRFPILNILDAIWINPIPLNGPGTSYREATRVNVIIASTDPIALDYWAAKHVLIQTANLKGTGNTDTMEPDNSAEGSFGNWLKLSVQEISAAGYRVTKNEDQMNIHVTHLQSE